jgi:hypothetical protein
MTAEAADKPVGSKAAPWVLAAGVLAFIDGSVVNVGLPAIGRSLHGGAEGLQWVVNTKAPPAERRLRSRFWTRWD